MLIKKLMSNNEKSLEKEKTKNKTEVHMERELKSNDNKGKFIRKILKKGQCSYWCNHSLNYLQYLSLFYFKATSIVTDKII